jgi:hypothetical protein
MNVRERKNLVSRLPRQSFSQSVSYPPNPGNCTTPVHVAYPAGRAPSLFIYACPGICLCMTEGKHGKNLSRDRNVVPTNQPTNDLTEGGDLREAQVDALGLSCHSCLKALLAQ